MSKNCLNSKGGVISAKPNTKEAIIGILEKAMDISTICRSAIVRSATVAFGFMPWPGKILSSSAVIKS